MKTLTEELGIRNTQELLADRRKLQDATAQIGSFDGFMGVDRTQPESDPQKRLADAGNENPGRQRRRLCHWNSGNGIDQLFREFADIISSVSARAVFDGGLLNAQIICCVCGRCRGHDPSPRARECPTRCTGCIAYLETGRELGTPNPTKSLWCPGVECEPVGGISMEHPMCVGDRYYGAQPPQRLPAAKRSEVAVCVR